MFRKPSKDDITDEEYEKYIIKQSNDEILFLKENIIPEFIAFAISNGYINGYEEFNDYDIHIKSELTYFNLIINENDIKNKVTKILKEKYNLIIISEKPLDFKRS